MQNIKIWDKVEVCDIGDWDEWDGGWYFIWTVEWKHICTPEEKNIKNFLSCDSYMDNFAPFDYVRPAQIWLEQKLPIQWERVEIRAVHQWTTSTWDEAMFVCFFLNKPLVKFDDDTFDVFDEWRFPPKKTELTLAEVEEKLGLEKGSLIIK